MKSFTIAALLSCIATANVQKEHASLAQLMMLHDEMVAKIDEPNNDVDANKGLFDRLLGSDPEDPQQATEVDISVDVQTQAPVSQKLQPRFD